MEQQPGRRDPVDPEDFDLLGFVLGALETEEHERIAAAIEQHPELQEAVDHLYSSLPKTPDTWSTHRPPTGLARRTCERIADFDRSREVLAKVAVASDESQLATLSANSTWSWKDFAILAAACLSVALILFPSILNSRHQARIRYCQNNLRQVSVALKQYTELFSGYLPAGSVDGPLGVAGAFGPILKDASLIDDPMLLCPSTDELACSDGFTIPSCEAVCNADGTELTMMQRNMGGSYAFTLGFYDKSIWIPPTAQSRPYVMVMADVSDPNNPRQSSQHGQKGQNVLFEDGHIAFLQDCSSHLIGDDSIYLNRYGLVAAGVDANDTVLGPSFARPAGFVASLPAP